jgi:cobalt-zinc-cadmium efflux system membrane fusion protein
MKILPLNKSTLIIVLAFATSCATKEKPDTSESKPVNLNEVVLTEEQFKIANILLGQVEQRTISGTIKANGMLDVPPQNLVTISAPMGGFVKTTELLQGMKVKKGQEIVTLEHPDYIQLQQDYLEGKSQLEFLQLEYQRQEELAKDNVNAAKILQQSRSNYFTSRARVHGLQAKLRLIHIDPAELENGVINSTIKLYSPIAGYVTQVNVNIGMHVNPADVMFRIMDNNHLHAEAQVFEKDITKLKIGQKVRLTLSNDSRERTATVYLIGKEITSERTVRVHCHMDQEDPSLIPGMYFSALIETDRQTVSALPGNAVVNFEGNDYIFVVKNEPSRQYLMKEVKKGTTENGFVEISLPSDLPAHTLIVVNGAYALLSFLKNTAE